MSEVQLSVERLIHCTLKLTLPTTSFKSIFLTLSLQPQLWLITHDPTAMGIAGQQGLPPMIQVAEGIQQQSWSLHYLLPLCQS